MTPLTQQLEDKKKDLDVFINELDVKGNMRDKYGRFRNPFFKIVTEAEITILEQAIAEIKELQSQQNKIGKDLYNPNEKTDQTGSADISNLLQKQRQEILDKIDKCYEELECSDEVYNRHILQAINYIHNEIKQLNKPKTEKENSKQQLTNSEGKI